MALTKYYNGAKMCLKSCTIWLILVYSKFVVLNRKIESNKPFDSKLDLNSMGLGVDSAFLLYL